MTLVLSQRKDRNIFRERYSSRISKTNGATTNGSTASFDKLRTPLTTRYYYDGDELILEKNGAAVYYIHGPRIDEIISDSRGYCYHTDGLGSIVNLTDSSGNKANSYTYMAFGKMRSQSGTASNAWLFTGRQYDSESGLYYLRNRYYDPKTGRFITRDPIGIAGGVNLYQYCGNDPVNMIDPWGLDSYKINNIFNTAIPTGLPVSHTFTATTDINPVTGKETVTETYSWVNTNGGMWEKTDKEQNKIGAQAAIDRKIGAWKKGGESLDKHVDALFEKRKDQSGGFYTYNGICKVQTNRLINDAIKRMNAENATKKGNNGNCSF